MKCAIGRSVKATVRPFQSAVSFAVATSFPARLASGRRLTTAALNKHDSFMSVVCAAVALSVTMQSNGEVEGPVGDAQLEPRAHNISRRPRRHYRASRHPPTIVRRHT